MQEIHAHKILAMIEASDGNYDSSGLVAILDETYGKESTFYTCSASGMTAAELVDFFLIKEKVVSRDGRLQLNRANACGH